MTLLRFSALAAALLLGCGTAPTICGCEDDCNATASCTSETTTTPPSCPDDPADGDVLPGCGIWVSTTIGDDGNPGTQLAPVKTLQHAVDIAAKGPGRVYACAETYEAAVVVPAGVSLHGGWFCQGGWEPAPADTRASIRPVHDDIPLRLVAGKGESLITDIVVRAPDAANPGGSSIAALADVGAAAEMRRVELIAGDGANGAAGEAGGAQPASAGAAGVGGLDGCFAAIGQGGLAPVTTCDDGPTAGGVGGDGAEAFAQGGGDGAPDLGAGAGGLGEDAAPVCSGGKDGADGVIGADGLGAPAGGSLTADGYLGPAGASGTAGTRAQGGGGGGASFGGSGCGLLPHGGAGGGSGGAGGCGGKPGAAGGAGGASIALASRSDGIRLRDVRLVAGAGGAGGLGGAGQLGGLGGLPGLGGAQYSGPPPVHSGCPGGFGGKGGAGGNGGGGAGGPSAAIAHLFGAAPAQEDVELVVGEAGAGGLGGNPAVETGAGADGMAVKVLEL